MLRGQAVGGQEAVPLEPDRLLSRASHSLTGCRAIPSWKVCCLLLPTRSEVLVGAVVIGSLCRCLMPDFDVPVGTGSFPATPLSRGSHISLGLHTLTLTLFQAYGTSECIGSTLHGVDLESVGFSWMFQPHPVGRSYRRFPGPQNTGSVARCGTVLVGHSLVSIDAPCK